METRLTHYSDQNNDELLIELTQPQPWVIALEGGPCGGKTTTLDRLVQGAKNEDRTVVVVPEAATPLITELQSTGRTIPELATYDREGFIAFETNLLGAIAANITQEKQRYAGTDAIIVADRSDIGAYVTTQEHNSILGSLGLTAPPHLNLVDKLIYMPSLAHENPERYEALMKSNAARFETAEDAVKTCERNLSAIGAHPELSLYWGGDFETKTKAATEEITHPEQHTSASRTTLADIGQVHEWRHVDHILTPAKAQKLEAAVIIESYGQYAGQNFCLEDRLTENGHRAHSFIPELHEKTTQRRPLTHEQLLQLGRLTTARRIIKQRHYLVGEGTNKILITATLDAKKEQCMLKTTNQNREPIERFLNIIQKSGAKIVRELE